jgi:hypothetical protein
MGKGMGNIENSRPSVPASQEVKTTVECRENKHQPWDTPRPTPVPPPSQRPGTLVPGRKMTGPFRGGRSSAGSEYRSKNPDRFLIKSNFLSPATIIKGNNYASSS